MLIFHGEMFPLGSANHRHGMWGSVHSRAWAGGGSSPKSSSLKPSSARNSKATTSPLALLQSPCFGTAPPVPHPSTPGLSPPLCRQDFIFPPSLPPHRSLPDLCRWHLRASIPNHASQLSCYLGSGGTSLPERSEISKRSLCAPSLGFLEARCPQKNNKNQLHMSPWRSANAQVRGRGCPKVLGG